MISNSILFLNKKYLLAHHHHRQCHVNVFELDNHEIVPIN